MTELNLLSQRVKTLLDSDDVVTAERELWAELEADGTPLVEPDPGDPSSGLVTFLWRADRPAEHVLVSETISGRTPQERAMTLVPGSSTWYATWPVRSDVRVSYRFDVLEGTVSHLLPDPLARVREPRNSSLLGPHDEPAIESVLVMPDAEPLTWADRRPEVPRGTVTEHRLSSRILGDDREVWVYLPPEAERCEELSVVLVLDGQAHHSALTVLDNLHADGAITPTLAVLVRQLDRNVELACNADFSRFLAEEVMPWAHEHYAFTADPARTVIAGCSLGGLASLYTGLRHAEVFGNALSQSGSCWWDPQGLKEYFHVGEAVVKPVGSRTRRPAIIGEFIEAETVPLRIYQEVGALENGPPPATPGQIHANRHFRDVLELKGYDVRYHEFAGGHDDAWWRSRLGDGLIHLLGKDR